jgi:hypothetical protein
LFSPKEKIAKLGAACAGQTLETAHLSLSFKSIVPTFIESSASVSVLQQLGSEVFPPDPAGVSWWLPQADDAV